MYLRVGICVGAGLEVYRSFERLNAYTLRYANLRIPTREKRPLGVIPVVPCESSHKALICTSKMHY